MFSGYWTKFGVRLSVCGNENNSKASTCFVWRMRIGVCIRCPYFERMCACVSKCENSDYLDFCLPFSLLPGAPRRVAVCMGFYFCLQLTNENTMWRNVVPGGSERLQMGKRRAEFAEKSILKFFGDERDGRQKLEYDNPCEKFRFRRFDI